MIKDFVQQLQQELGHLADAGQASSKRELELALQATLAKFNLVTRTEFDAQAAVLQRTRQKLEALEQQLAHWEQKT